MSRNPDLSSVLLSGRKVNQHIGGGVKFDYFIIDYHRRGPTEPGKTYDERVNKELSCINDLYECLKMSRVGSNCEREK